MGRGLSSLIPISPPRETEPRSAGVPVGAVAGEAATGTLEIPVMSIATNPRQPRRHFSETALEELAQSVRQSGILQPLIVRKTERGYELIAGERRLRAAKRAGLQNVPVVVKNSSEQVQLEIALIENLQREDLNPIEEAQGYDRLSREFSLTQEEIAKRVGKDRSTVTNLLRLLKLSSVVQEMIATGSVSMGHARALLPLEDPRRQEALASKIEKEGLSVRQVEVMVRGMMARQPQKVRRLTDKEAIHPNLRHLTEELQRSLGTRVEITAKGKGGEIRIQYYNTEDLKRLSDRLLK